MQVEADAISLPSVETTSSTPLQSKLARLETVLKGVKSGLKGLPPVQSAIDGLEVCLNNMQIREQTRHEYGEILAGLTGLADQLQKQPVKEDPWNLPHSIDNVARAIEEQTSFIRERQDLSRISQLAMAQDDVEAVLKCYWRVGALFQQLHADISSGIWDVEKEQQMDTRLKDLCPAYDAYHDAALPTSATARSGCTKDTRVDLLNIIQQWTQQEGASKIFWLNGMAGTGKTTIAYTLCEMLQTAKQLGASFFCSRNSPDCRNVNRMVPTIAYQLGRYSNPYRKALYNALRNDPDAAKRKIDKQFEMLISKPLAEMGNAMPVDVVVVIDALDEVSDADGAQGVLNMLLGRADSLPIKFFVSSRPEPAISERMTTASGAMRSILWLHDIERSLVQADIHTYLTEALSSIHATPVEIQQLAESSGSLFIFAATAVRYITLNKGLVDYKQRLRVVLNLHPSQGSIKYKGIDELYYTVLSNALDADVFEGEEIMLRKQVLWTVVCAREPLTMTGIAEVLDLLNIEEVQRAILPLQSVLYISEATGVVSTLHASFPDFLLSKDRAGPFYCDNASHESHMAGFCFRVMNRSLRFNICDLESSYRLDRDIPDLEDRVERKISTGLFYSCRYWGEHLTRTSLSTPLLYLLESFLQSRLLFWMEVLNLKRKIGHGENVLSQVLEWLSMQGELTDLWDFTYDARNFLTTFAGNPTSLSTPHIYVSTLPFTSTQSCVRTAYLSRMRGLIQVRGVVVEGRTNVALATWDVEARVDSIAQSSDGKRIVSGASNNGVSVWDAPSGARIMGPLGGCEDWALSVAFSPDNTRIASSSTDCTVRLWDAQSGALLVEPICGHTGSVYCVAFSSDGTRLASSSRDGTIRLWDAWTGVAIGGPYTGHGEAVWSVSFSPNGEHLASGSEDWTIRVWNWRTGVAVRGPIIGHNSAVYTVAYSSDGLRLASGSGDCAVRVWDMPSGALLAGPFEGHTRAILSVSFSPDNVRIVSGSDDRTIHIWEGESGNLLAGPFKGHDRTINSVLFTLDGTRILSGSDDGTIRVWDARHRTIGASKSSRYTGNICSVALSPDGTRVAAGSDDRTICVWDTHSGALLAGPFTGHTSYVHSVAFSPDGARIVSGSDDGSLRVWCAFTGTLLVGPIQGHPGRVQSVAFSPDGSQISSSSIDGAVRWKGQGKYYSRWKAGERGGEEDLEDPLVHRLWDSRTGTSIAGSFKGHSWVVSIAPSPDGLHIVSGLYDAMARKWGGSNGIACWTSGASPSGVDRMEFSPDAPEIRAHRSVLGWHRAFTNLTSQSSSAPTDQVSSATLSPDGTRLVSFDTKVCVWDTESGTMLAGPFEGHAGRVTSVGFSSDGARIVSGSVDATIRFWDIATATRPDATSFRNLSINRDGWLTDSNSQRLLWVPIDLRHLFTVPSLSSSLVIGDGYTIRGDHSTLLLGERWSQCFNVPPVSSL